MLIVLADNFSGAAEIAGIAHRYGLTVELQLELDLDVDKDVLVIDTNTRMLTEIQAVKKTEKVIMELMKSPLPLQFFKKIDALMRGHMVAEINVLQYHFDCERIFLLPSNPTKNQVIVDGQMLVEDIVLANADKNNPSENTAHQSYLEDMIDTEDLISDYAHIGKKDPLPKTGLLTADISTLDDLRRIMDQTIAEDLICGAVDCFEMFLQNKGYEIAESKTINSEKKYHLIFNGSTFRNEEEKNVIEEQGLTQQVIPEPWRGNSLVIENDYFWHTKALEALLSSKNLVLHTNQPVRRISRASELFVQSFKEFLDFAYKKVDAKEIQLGLTGGGVAATILRQLGVTKLHVRQEISPGVVSLVSTTDEKMSFVIKPGNYHWPEEYLEEIGSNGN